VKSYGIHVVIGNIGSYFFLCKPTFVRESELKFVAVFFCGVTAYDWKNWRQVHFGYALQCVFNNLLFPFELLPVVEVLPTAASAYTEVFAERFGAVSAVFVKFHSYTFAVFVFFARNLYVGHIAWHDVRHEHHHFANSGNSPPFGGYSCYGNVLKYRHRFVFPTHGLCVFKLQR